MVVLLVVVVDGEYDTSAILGDRNPTGAVGIKYVG